MPKQKRRSPPRRAPAGRPARERTDRSGRFASPRWVKVDEISGFTLSWRVTCQRCRRVADFPSVDGSRPDEAINAELAKHGHCEEDRSDRFGWDESDFASGGVTIE